MPNKHFVLVYKLCLPNFLIIGPIACLGQVLLSVIVRPFIIHVSALNFAGVIIAVVIIDLYLSSHLIILEMAFANSSLFVSIHALAMHLPVLQLSIVIVLVFEEYFCFSFYLVALPQSLQR